MADDNGAIDLSELAGGEPPAGPRMIIPPDAFAGTWANHAEISQTVHEVTLDFYRIGPGGQQGILVSRVNCSPLLLEQLGAAIAAHLEKRAAQDA